MRITIAAAAFDPHGKRAAHSAGQAAEVAAREGADLLLLPGTNWASEDVLSLSARAQGLLICAGTPGAALIAKGGAALLMQPRLYGKRAQGEDIALFTHEGMTMAILADEDAYAPQAARAAALLGACILLCPVRELLLEGPWAQAQQNGLYAVATPAGGEARIFSPMGGRFPDGVMARGRPGSMAIARIEIVDWARGRISRDPISALNRGFAAAVPADSSPDEPPAAPLKVAAVQRSLDIAGGKDKLLARTEALCAEAAQAGCGMIVFPEMHWIDAFGSLPGVPKRVGAAKTAFTAAEIELDDGDVDALTEFFPDVPTPPRLPIWAHAALRYGSGRVARLARNETARLAKKYNLIVHSGTFPERSKKILYNTAVIALPDGLLVEQRKLHLSLFERSIGFTAGEELAVFPANGALCCALAGADAEYSEPFLAARRAGCDFISVPMFNGEKYYQPAEMRGAWARAKEMGLFAIRPALTGRLFGRVYTGYAAIFSPFAQDDGVLARSRGPVGDELIYATLDFEKLRQTRMGKPGLNRALEASLPRLYRGG